MEVEEYESLTDAEKISRTQSVIDASLPTELHDRFRQAMIKFDKFWTKPGAYSWPRPGGDYRTDMTPEQIRRCLVVFKSYSSYGSEFSISHDIMTKTCEMFGFRDGEQVFTSAEPAVLKRWLKALPINSYKAMYVHLKMSARVGISSVPRLMSVNLSREAAKNEVTHFLKKIEADSISAGLNAGLDFSTPSEEFMESLRYARLAFRELYVRKEEILVLLRIVYGETTYLQVTDRLFTELLEVTPDQILDIFDNWNEWQVFPSEWISELLHTESPKRYS